MKIGIPNGLFTDTSNLMYKTFFESLGISVVFSGNTTNEIKEEGIRLSVDEGCLASKIYIGHVASLVERSKDEKIDYIFIPRLCTYKKNETECVRFYAMYDICKNMFNANFISLNLDYKKGISEVKSYIDLAKRINVNPVKAYLAYMKAVKVCKDEEYYRDRLLKSKLNKDKSKILIVSHAYVFDDAVIGKPICNWLKKQEVELIYASKERMRENDISYKKISSSLYWKQSKVLMSGLINNMDNIDGIIYLSVFPCGTDSLTNELMQRKIKDVPSINLIVDEHSGFEGYITRLESFLDIVESNKIKSKRGERYEKIYC